MSKPDPTTVTIQAFERLVGAAPAELAGLLKAGTIRRAAPGRLGLIEAVRGYVAHVKATARDASLTTAMADARAARAEASELSLALENRDQIPDEDAEAALQHLVGAILEATGGLAARVSRDRAYRAIFEEALRQAQQGIADDLLHSSSG